MSKREILEELPRLGSAELQEIRDRIWQLEEEQLLRGSGKPGEEEKALLDRELEDYRRDPGAGSTWEDIQSRLKE